MPVTKLRPGKVSWAREDRPRLVQQDLLRREIAAWTRLCGPMLKHLSAATRQGRMGRYTVATWSRMTNEEGPDGLVRALADLIYDLTTHPTTSAPPLILGCLLAMQEALGDLPTEEIERRYRQALLAETPSVGSSRRLTEKEVSG